jgi:hypothetical protein
MPDKTTIKRGLSFAPEARAVLEKMPTADLLKVMEGLPMADNNNASNFSSAESQLDKEEMVKRAANLPAGALRSVLVEHGLIK